MKPDYAGMATEYIRVIARIRPSKDNPFSAHNVLNVDRNCIHISQSGGCSLNFTYDSVLNEDATQEDVFEIVGKRIVESCIDGYNGTIFAYGQTGSGKTHTMLGPGHEKSFMYNDLHKGIVPRAVELLFDLLEKKKDELGEGFQFFVSCAFVELYNEVIYDLLSSNHKQIQLRADDKATTLVDITRESVCSLVDMMRCVEFGWDRRSTASTAMNIESSRSHAIFIIEVTMEEEQDGIINKKQSTLNLVDLAGSERQSSTHAVGIRLKEANNINQSLSVLGRVIRTLSKGKAQHIPYRDSKLTHILRDSLGGNSRTSVIVSLHPDLSYYSETLSTLRFAQTCKMVKNHAQANREISGDCVTALKKEIARISEDRDRELAEKDSLIEKLTEEMRNEIEKYRSLAVSQELELQRLRVQLRCKNLQSASATTEEAEEKILEMYKKDMVSRLSLAGDSNELRVIELGQQLEQKEAEIQALQNRLNSIQSGLLNVNVSATAPFESPIKEEENDENVLNISTMTPKQRKERRRTRYTLSSQKEVIKKVKTGTEIVWGDEEIDDQSSKVDDDGRNFENKIFDLELERDNLKKFIDEMAADQVSKMQVLQDNVTSAEKKKEEISKLLEKNSEKLQKANQDCSRYSKQIQESEQVISKLEEDKAIMEAKWQAAKDDLEQMIQSKESQNTKLRKDHDEAVAELMNNHETILKELQKSIAEQQDIAQEQEASIACHMEILQGMKAKLTEKETIEKDLVSKNKEYEKLLQEIKLQLSEKENETKELLSKNMKNEKILQELNTKLSEKEKSENELISKVSKFEESVQDTNSKFTEKENLEKELTAKNKQFEVELRNLQIQLTGLESSSERQKRQLERREEELKNLQIDKKALEEEYEKNYYIMKKDLEEVRKEKDELVHKCVVDVKLRENESSQVKKDNESLKQEIDLLRLEMQKKQQQFVEDADKQKEESSHLLDKVKIADEDRERMEKQIEEYESKIATLEDELDKANKVNDLLSQQHSEDVERISDVVGHNNLKQKIKTLSKIKTENTDLKKEITELKIKNKKLEQLVQPSPQPEPAGPRVTRATRSRTSKIN